MVRPSYRCLRATTGSILVARHAGMNDASSATTNSSVDALCGVDSFSLSAGYDGDTLMIGRILWQEFFNNRDWPVASAVSIVMLMLLIIPIMIFHRAQSRELEAKLA